MRVPRVEFRDAGEAFESDRIDCVARLAAELHAGSGRRVLICAADAAQARALDERLWALDAALFLPHALADDPDAAAAAVVIAAADADAAGCPLAINLRDGIAALDCERIIELIPGDEAAKQSARARWRAYRARGIEPVKVDAGQD